MSDASKQFRKQSAEELQKSRRSKGKVSAEAVKSAASYRALADNEEWLDGERPRSRKKQK